MKLKNVIRHAGIISKIEEIQKQDDDSWESVINTDVIEDYSSYEYQVDDALFSTGEYQWRIKGRNAPVLNPDIDLKEGDRQVTMNIRYKVPDRGLGGIPHCSNEVPYGYETDQYREHTDLYTRSIMAIYRNGNMNYACFEWNYYAVYSEIANDIYPSSRDQSYAIIGSSF
ncbi:MAG: hypothetical protein ACLFPF_10690 [Halanaerobiales bacterium]